MATILITCNESLLHHMELLLNDCLGMEVTVTSTEIVLEQDSYTKDIVTHLRKTCCHILELQTMLKRFRRGNVPRNILTVIGNLQGIIPQSEEKLHNELKVIAQSVLFTSPDGMGQRFGQIAHALAMFVPLPPTEEWQKKVSRIIRDEE
jgi:iron only hydrogenase large subunit-like protein